MPLVRIELMQGKSTGFKKDVFINLIEVKKENGSFGKGLASYA